ncbi:hypothetical protein [Vogesella sp. XCS3]|uniref:hypothetical protein n=1 Tax=Vogesella sp. XCS3 TaxID=2877939 RepID=UPI001D0B1048|nr:hypothetical protein [Vogesella sp. XCS3]UDM18832.1 hypothetical protein LCH97_18340 [Vogesella sp. XCS3]
MKPSFLALAILPLAFASSALADQISGPQAEVIIARAVENVAKDAVVRFHPKGTFVTFLKDNGADALMANIRGRRTKAVMALTGVMFEAGCKKMAGDYFRYNYQTTPMEEKERLDVRLKFDRLAGPGSAWCTELGGDEDEAKLKCHKSSRYPKRQKNVWLKLAQQAEVARSKRNAYLASIKFNRYDYVAAVTSTGLDIFDPAMQRPDNAACAVMADEMSKSLFLRLRHDKVDEAYYVQYRVAIEASREIWHKMDALEK